MITLSFQTVESLVFMNEDIHVLFPEFADLFNSWRLGKSTGVPHLVHKALIDFMRAVTNDHIHRLANYFNASSINFQAINTAITNHLACPVDDIECWLNENNPMNLAIDRKGDQVYLSTWR